MQWAGWSVAKISAMLVEPEIGVFGVAGNGMEDVDISSGDGNDSG